MIQVTTVVTQQHDSQHLWPHELVPNCQALVSFNYHVVKHKQTQQQKKRDYIGHFILVPPAGVLHLTLFFANEKTKQNSPSKTKNKAKKAHTSMISNKASAMASNELRGIFSFSGGDMVNERSPGR